MMLSPQQLSTVRSELFQQQIPHFWASLSLLTFSQSPRAPLEKCNSSSGFAIPWD